MTAWLRVCNWETFQHYKERRPPWIKLHTEVLDDIAFERLHDASKAHLMCIWVLASKHEGRIPDDPNWVARKMGATVPVDLETLMDAGFLEREHDASTALSLARADAGSQEAETEVEKETTSPRKRDEVWDTLIDLFGEPSNDNERGKRNKAVKLLKQSLNGAADVERQIRRRAKRWPALYPTANLTDTALANNWTSLAPPRTRPAANERPVEEPEPAPAEVAQEHLQRWKGAA